jgi:hypothetical protein
MRLRETAVILALTWISLFSPLGLAADPMPTINPPQSRVTATAQQTQQSTSGSTVTTVNEATDTLKTAPSMVAPGLSTTLTDTCMGSSTGAASFLALGLSGGTTWKDEECIRRLNARQLASMNELDAAKELMCGNPEINAVYAALGRPCKLKPSNSVLVPGGALVNYRSPVEQPKTVSVSNEELIARAREARIQMAMQGRPMPK